MTRRVLLTVLALFLGILVGHVFTPSIPGCFEDEVAIRYQVPGPWTCVPIDVLTGAEA